MTDILYCFLKICNILDYLLYFHLVYRLYFRTYNIVNTNAFKSDWFWNIYIKSYYCCT